MRTAPGGRPCAVDAGRTFLGWVTTQPMYGRKFSKVVLMGPYWSGTNAVREEVAWRFPGTQLMNPDKLEVCASTLEAVQTLCDGLANGPVLSEALLVGQRRVPRGYKLLGGPQAQAFLARISRARVGRRAGSSEDGVADGAGGGPSEHGGGAHGGVGDPGSSPREAAAVASSSACSALKPPVSLCFGPDTDGHCAWWKHTIRLEEHGCIDTDDDTLVILVAKDPLFWLKSMSKHQYEMKVDKEASHDILNAGLEDSKNAGLDVLFRALEHGGRHYRDAVELWSVAMRSFLNEALYPKDRCVLLRYEDFLFRFADVMTHLAAFLRLKGGRLKEPPNASKSKSHGREVRGREDALSFYFWSRNRHNFFVRDHFDRMRELSSELLVALGYDAVPDAADCRVLDPAARCSWVPELFPGDVVATSYCSCPSLAAGGADADAGAACGRGHCAESSTADCGLGAAGRPPPRRRRAWALVVEADAAALGGAAGADAQAPCRCRGKVVVELLKAVPHEWKHKSNDDDWTTLDWPDKSRSSWPKDVSSHQVVPREWVDLRLPCPLAGQSGATAPLTEEGYRAMVALRSTPQMADFVSRVIADLEVNGARCGRVLDRYKLECFAKYFSGEADVQSLAQIRRELPEKEVKERWVTFVPPMRQHTLPLVPPASAAAAQGEGRPPLIAKTLRLGENQHHRWDSAKHAGAGAVGNPASSGGTGPSSPRGAPPPPPPTRPPLPAAFLESAN